MEFQNSYEGIDPYAVKVIQVKSRKIVGVPGFSADDVEDIEQDLAIHLTEQIPNFDHNKSKWETFVNSVLDNKIKDILKHKFADKRSSLQSDCSLNTPFSSLDNDGVEVIETVRNQDLPWNRFLDCITDYEACEFRADFIEAVRKLPLRLQSLLIQLTEDNISDISKTTGIPRGTIYEHIKELRQHLSNSGIEKYF